MKMKGKNNDSLNGMTVTQRTTPIRSSRNRQMKHVNRPTYTEIMLKHFGMHERWNESGLEKIETQLL